MLSFFFFQAEDGIRDHCVTGVQTCALPISDRSRGPGRLLRRPDPRGPLEPDRLELLGGRRSAAEGRRDECGPDRRAPPGLGQPPKGAATGDVAPTLLPPALRSPRAVPPRRHLHHRCRRVRGRPHRGTLHRGAPGVFAPLLRAEGPRAPGMVAPDGCPQPVGRSLVGRRGEHRASDPGGGRLAHPRPDPGVAPSVATAIASPSTFLLVLAYDGTDYRGWQIQPDSRTVQGVLRDAARRLAPDARL